MNIDHLDEIAAITRELQQLSDQHRRTTPGSAEDVQLQKRIAALDERRERLRPRA